MEVWKVKLFKRFMLALAVIMIAETILTVPPTAQAATLSHPTTVAATTATTSTSTAATKGQYKTEVTVTVKRNGTTTTLEQYIVGDVQPNYHSWGQPSNSGCQTLTIEYRYYHTYIWPIPDHTIYVFVFDVYWCWWHPGHDVGSFHWYAHYIDVDSLWYPQGPHYSYYHYMRDPGYPNSALRVDVAEQIQNCIGIQPAGCISNHNDWAWVGAHSDGTASWDMGR